MSEYDYAMDLDRALDVAIRDSGQCLDRAMGAYVNAGPSPDVTTQAMLSIANSLFVLSALRFEETNCP